MKRLFYILTALLLFASCERQSDLVTVLSVDNVDWQYEVVESAANLHLNIYAESQSSTVQRIILTSGDVEYKDRNLLDSVLTMPVKKVKMSYYYTLPYYSDTTKVKIELRSYDQKGNTMSHSVTLRVAPGAKALRSIDDITLYSAASGGKSAFSMTTYQPVYYDEVKSDSLSFYDVLNEDSTRLDTMSYTWHSKSGLLFSRSEGFNFSEATAKSLRDAWPNHVKSSTIKNLRADDVLLIGKGDQAIGVVKILSVHDEPDTANDRYIFSLKVIQSK